ncbi:MAG: J domain-containing protein [Actinomycetota bacterium]|nr:J domain-containing protein [Actinomycetota bacterium]
MNEAQARAILDVRPGASLDEVKAAWRKLMRRHHPDNHAGSGEALDDAVNRTIEATNAYRLLLRSARAGGVGEGRGEREETIGVSVGQDGTFVVSATMPETFALLREAAEVVGDLRYEDRRARILQALVGDGRGGPWSYLTLTVQPRGTVTEVFATIEATAGASTPPMRPLIDRLAREIRRPRW